MTDTKKQIGIWLDYKEAFIVNPRPGKGADSIQKHVVSNIEWGVPKGGTRSKTPWGPQGGVNEQTFLARRKQEEKAYFSDILAEIDPQTDELFIFGPAEAKIGLNQLIKSIKNFHPELKAVKSADSMTQNQIVAAVRDFFNVEPA
jgi:hypothetical protein